MPSYTKGFSFNSTIEGWAATVGGATGLTMSLQVGVEESPNDVNAGSGSLESIRQGKSLTNGTPYWEWAGTYETLGVTPGETVTDVNMSFDWEVLTYTTGASSTIGPAELRDSAGTTLLGTFSASAAYAATSAYATRTGTALTGRSDASDLSIRLRIGVNPKTGNSSSAINDIYYDWIFVSITTSGGAAAVIPDVTVARTRT